MHYYSPSFILFVLFGCYISYVNPHYFSAATVVDASCYHKYDNYSVIFAITDDSNTLRLKVKNTIDLLSFYQQVYRVRSVVFSNSTPIVSYASSKSLVVIREFQRNKYGVPLYRSMMVAMTQRFKSQYYGYINSDILIDPSLFRYLNSFSKFKTELHTPVLYASRVYAVRLNRIALSFKNTAQLIQSYHSIEKGQIRILGSADLFLHSSDYPFDTFPDAVIGRAGIDNVIICHAKAENVKVVDITGTGHYVHQGIDGFFNISRKDDDKTYNIPILKRYKKYKGVLHNADYIYTNSSIGLVRTLTVFLEKSQCTE